MQVHKQPQLVFRILNKLQAENHYFIINIDSKCDCFEEFKKGLSDIRNITISGRKNIMHGGFSQVECTIEQMKLAKKIGEDEFDYIHTISGQDYPCVSNEEFDTFFENNDKSYMWLDTQEELDAWKFTKYSHRLEHWYLMDILNAKWMNRIHLAGIIRRGLYWIPRRYKYMDQLWGGWNWFSIRIDVMNYLLDYIDNNKKYIKRFAYTTSSDELIFSSILYWKAKELQIETRNPLRFVEWHPKRGYKGLPLILNENEFEDIINSGCFFCRKVDEKESAILLDKIDEYIANKKL